MSLTSRTAALAALASAGMLLGGVGAAEAAPQTHAYSVSGAGPQSEVFGFERFDTGLGTLTSVTISVLSFGLVNQSTASILGGEFGDLVEVDQDATLRLTGPLGALFSGAASSGASCSVEAFSADCSGGANGTTSLSTGSVTLSLPGELAAFIGSSNTDSVGTVNLSVEIANYVSSVVYTQAGFVAGDVSDSFNLLQWTPTVSVAYNFDGPVVATPEPASMALFASGLGLMGMLRRRRVG